MDRSDGRIYFIKTKTKEEALLWIKAMRLSKDYWQTRENKEITLSDEIILMCCRKDRNKESFADPVFSSVVSIAGSIVMELILRGSVGLKDTSVVILDSSVTGDSTVDETVALIAMWLAKHKENIEIEYLLEEITGMDTQSYLQMRDIWWRSIKKCTQKSVLVNTKGRWNILDTNLEKKRIQLLQRLIIEHNPGRRISLPSVELIKWKPKNPREYAFVCLMHTIYIGNNVADHEKIISGNEVSYHDASEALLEGIESTDHMGKEAENTIEALRTVHKVMIEFIIKGTILEAETVPYPVRL